MVNNNVNKTEALLFRKTISDSISISIDGSSFFTKQSMKVLGIIFDTKLKCNVHIDKLIASGKGSLHGLRILRRNMGFKGFTQILISQLYSKLYYGAPVWLNHLSSRDMMRLESLHYNAQRVCFFGFHNKVPHQILNHDYMRATPKGWMNYCVSCEFIRIYTCHSPQSLFQRIWICWNNF